MRKVILSSPDRIKVSAKIPATKRYPIHIYIYIFEWRVNSLTNDEINRITDKLYAKFRGIPGVDKPFIQKCLSAISALGDEEVDRKLKYLASFL